MPFTTTPYISFPGNAAEAFPYYREIFGGELDLMTYDSMPQMEGMPFTPPPGAVSHAVLTAPGVSLCGGDAMGENLPDLRSDVYSFLLTVDSVEEARDIIDRLVESGGEMAMPFEKAPWGDTYGQVVDRYGIRWDLTVSGAAE